ncbi:dirigent protein 18-like [Abrus precatorius]|uniref:Dirigent protein n=1 Tax=Abrus precatorius TaxID=3816 RepID=A0A8B8MBG2_ABRPR|nr:dirigent protein 18-like [Abrus precatorius]
MMIAKLQESVESHVSRILKKTEKENEEALKSQSSKYRIRYQIEELASTSETLGNKKAMESLTKASLTMSLALAYLATTIVAVDPVAATGKEPVIELYMHDILGGTNPTARPVTGLLGSIYSGQVPFAMPVGFNTPQGGIPIPNANGAIPTVNGVFGIPLGTGLAGTSFAQNSGNNNNQNNVQLQLGPDGLGIGFGTITVIDDVLTSQPELGSQIVGKAQGVYVASSADGTRQMMAFTALFEGGEYGDSLNFYGLYKIGSTMSQLSVIGGTGKFKNARGFAELRPLIPPGQIATDGAETLLRITIYLNY